MIVEAKSVEVRAMVAGIAVAIAVMVSLAWYCLGQETSLVSAGLSGKIPAAPSVHLWDRGTDRLEAVISAGMRRIGPAGTPVRP